MALSLDDIILHLAAEPKLIELGEVFGNSNPTELEIGTGKGGFLLEQARTHADRNYLGIEWANQYFKIAADRMARWGLGNVRMLRCDAGLFVTRCLGQASISALHVYHPDPWPKRRHHRRRLFNQAFVDAAVRALVDGAKLAVQTDHQEYFEQIEALLAAHAGLEQTLGAGQNGPEQGATVPTNFQIKYRREGRRIFSLTCIRKPRRLACDDK